MLVFSFTRFFVLMVFSGLLTVSFAQDFTAEQYKKAAWMATRFYGAQRSGIGPNWLSADVSRNTSFTKDAVEGIDLSGGWFDCGDHVMFGQTQFYTIYALLKAYEAFPTGFYDLYSGDYSGYLSNGDFSYGKGTPNGIPDIIDEVKYALDFAIKAAGDGFFVYQKGSGTLDHNGWWTAPNHSLKPQSFGGEKEGSRPIFINPNDGAMPAMAAAALAAGSRLLRPFYGNEYADQLALHAFYAWNYAKNRNSAVGDAQGNDEFYEANASVIDNKAIAAAELYFITADESYRTLAVDFANGVSDRSSWSLDYNNEEDFAIYTVAQFGLESYKDRLRADFVEPYVASVNAEGVGENGNDNWGELRYPVGQAYVAGLYSNMLGVNTYDSFIYNQVDYVLGSNSSKRSFVVGFCEGCSSSPQHPHHRGVYANNNNPHDTIKVSMTIPPEHQQFGALVGGARVPSEYVDNILDYKMTEVCSDYNVGLVASLGYILSRMQPTPNLKTAVDLEVQAEWGEHSVHLNFDSLGAQIRVTDLSGKLLHSESWESQKEGVIQGFDSGLYLIQIHHNGKQKSLKWLIK